MARTTALLAGFKRFIVRKCDFVTGNHLIDLIQKDKIIKIPFILPLHPLSLYLQSMELASVFHNGVQAASLKLDSVSLRASPQFRAPKWTRVQFPHPHLPTFFYAADCSSRRRAQNSSIACCRGTEQEDNLSSTKEGKGTSSQSSNGFNNVGTSHTPLTVGNPEEENKGHETYMSSVRNVALCVGTAVAFGIGLGLKDGVGKASEYFAGYILEQSLSVDNLFVFVLIFKYFKVPVIYQSRVLSYGIAGAIVFRLLIILLGTATLQRFEAVNLLLAAILLYSSFKLFGSEDDDSDLSNNFVVKTCQKFIPVTDNYDGNRFITVQDGVLKASNILGRPHLYFSR